MSSNLPKGDKRPITAAKFGPSLFSWYGIMSSEKRIQVDSSRNWFSFALLYLIFDYGRPQNVLPIGFLHLPIVTTLILAYYVFSKRLRINFSNIQIKLLWFFIFWLAVLTLFADNTRFAFNTTKTMVLYMPFILSIVGTVDTIDKLRRLIWVSVIVMGYVSVYSIMHGGVGAGTYFNDENDLSLYVNIWLPFCYFLFIQGSSALKRIIYGSCLVIGVVCVIVSFSRGGFLGLVSMMIVAWCYSSRKLVTLFFFCILGAAIYFIYFGGHLTSYFAEMSTITDTKGATALERILSWKSAWAMFLDNPLGVGGSNFPVHFHLYQVEGLKRGMYGRVAHSLWFTLIPELGIPGIIIFSLLLFYNIKDIFSLNRIIPSNGDMMYLQAISRAVPAALVAYFVSGSFLSVLYYPHYWYLIGIIVATVKVSKSLMDKQVLTDQKGV